MRLRIDADDGHEPGGAGVVDRNARIVWDTSPTPQRRKPRTHRWQFWRPDPFLVPRMPKKFTMEITVAKDEHES